MVSIIVPVLSESISAGSSLQAAVAAASGGGEVILADGGISGSASVLVRQFENCGVYIRTVRCTERRNPWTLFRMGVAEASYDKVLFTSVHEWVDSYGVASLAGEMDSLGVDVIQACKIKRIRRIAVKEAYPSFLPLHEPICGESLRVIVGMNGEDRIITPCVTDKLWRTDLLRESLRFDFDGSWGAGDILNFHYFRHARSLALTDISITNYRWSAPVPSYSYQRLKDLRRVYEVKMLAYPECCDGFSLELKAHLVKYVRDLIFQLGWTKEATVHYLGRELTDKFWRNAGLDLSIEDVVEEAAQTHKKDSIVNILKRLTV